MTNVRTGWIALAALGIIASPACGDTTGNNSTATAPDGVGGTGVGGVETAGVTNAGAPTTGGTLSVGGYPVQVGGFMSYGGFSMVAGGAMSWGGSPNTGGTEAGGTGETGGGAWSETGGNAAELPPNGATCLCLLAESLRVAGGWQTAGCSSDDPNNCTLQKAFCGQTCAGNASCGESCIATFSSQVFNDAATYSYGSCNVIIRCPAPSS